MKRLFALLFLLPLLVFGEGAENVRVGTQTRNVLSPLTINWTGTTLDFTGSTVSGLSNILLKTNGTTNGSQSLLNLQQGSNVTLTDNGSGQITIASTAGGSGTVTSVAVSGANGIGVSGSPITTSGTISLSLPITIAGTSGKTFTLSNNLTLAGTDGSTLNVGAGGTLGSAAFDSESALTKTDDTNVTLTLGGSPSTALLHAASITAGWSGTLAVSRGGTGAATAAAHKFFGNNTGSTAAPDFETIGTGDLPDLSATYVPTTRTLTIGPTTSDLSANRTFLSSVTDDAQTKASVVPNTAPSSGQILVGNAGGTAYAKQTLSGSGATATLSSAGVLTLSAIPNASLSNSAITIAGTSTSLGGSIGLDTISGVSSNGFLKRTGTNTWTNDSSTYLTGNQTITLSGDVTGSGATAITTTLAAGNAGNLNSGTLLAARMPALTGDVTSSAGSVATTIPTGTVTDDKGALLVKPACAVVAVSNLTLSGEQTIDGITTSSSLVLATAQTTGSENGPWVSSSGAWTRPTWYSSGSTTQAPRFLTTFIRLGTTYSGSTWRMTTASVTIDTTSTTWVQTPISLASSNVTGQLANANLANSSITIGGASTSLGGTVTETTQLDSISSTQGVVLYRGSSAWSGLATGSAGSLLRSGGSSANPSWTTPTYPNAASTSGKVIVSDGTNFVTSTPTFPNASATSNKVIKSDGTNWVASTETYAAPGTSGNRLVSDGTNWTSVGLGLVGGGLTADTTVNNTITYTTGGVTYAAPDLASGQIYRITSFGTFTVANSATSRNMQVAAYWGSTQLTTLAVTLHTNAAQTFGFRVESILQGTSTTAIWSSTIINTATQPSGNADPGARFANASSGTTTGLTTSGQSIDLRFSMSTSVSGDSWAVKNVLIERLQ
jgi:hypothetical protein